MIQMKTKIQKKLYILWYVYGYLYDINYKGTKSTKQNPTYSIKKKNALNKSTDQKQFS